MQKVRVRARRAAVRVSPCLYGNGITPITTHVSSVQDPREQQGVARERGSRQHAVYHEDMHFARRVVYLEDVLSISKTCSSPAGLSNTKTCRLPRRRAVSPAGSSTTKTCCLSRRHAVRPQGWPARRRAVYTKTCTSPAGSSISKTRVSLTRTCSSPAGLSMTKNVYDENSRLSARRRAPPPRVSPGDNTAWCLSRQHAPRSQGLLWVSLS